MLSLFESKVFNQEAKMAMLSFQIYSMLIKHSDFHAKNMGILEIGKNKFIGTPLYDVISVGVYNGTADDLGLPLSKEQRKRKKYTFEDMLFIANTLNVPTIKSKEIIKRTIEVFLDRFPAYIEKTKALESSYALEMQSTRIGKKRFSERLQSLYDNKLIELKKLGVLQALGIVEKYGGLLHREQKSRFQKNNVTT
jgi:serine/threonine-protein kinase HipA